MLTADLPLDIQAAHNLPNAHVASGDSNSEGNGLDALLDAKEIGWASVRNLTINQFANDVAIRKNDNILIDIEVNEIGTQQFISGVWQNNVDGRLWAEHHNFTSNQFRNQWSQYRDEGYRLIDQESYVLDGQRYFAGIWMSNVEGYTWSSYQNATSAELADQFGQNKDTKILIDFDAYTVGDSTRYASAWVENAEGLQWVMHHNMTTAEFSEYSDVYNAFYRLYDIEAYQVDGKQRYAAIWIENRNDRSWAEVRDLDAHSYGNHWLRYRDLGYRLTDFEEYETGEGVRYAGVWRQNTDRPDWYLRSDIDAMANAHLDEYSIPGMSVAVVHEGQIEYLRGFGHQDVANDKWYSAHTVNRLASVSKAIAGVLLMRLADQNKIDPAATTRIYAPELPVHHTHTLEQLTSNRGGVGHYSQLGLGTVNTQYGTALEASALFWSNGLISSPGTSYSYSTHGYTLLGSGIEGATGESIGDVLSNELGSGLGLTTLRAEDRSITNEFRTTLYNTNNTEAIADNISWKVLGGGLEASAYDLIRFSAMLMDGLILSNEAMEQLGTVPSPNNVSYAMGWSVGTQQGEFSIRKDGSQLGANTYLRLFPELDLGIVVLINRRNSQPGQLSSDIANAILTTLPDMNNPPAGDVNNDGNANNLDITPFIAALQIGGAADDPSQVAAFLAQVPGGSFATADANEDGSVDNLDITPFVNLIAQSAGVAGPSHAAVASVQKAELPAAMMATAAVRRPSLPRPAGYTHPLSDTGLPDAFETVDIMAERWF